MDMADISDEDRLIRVLQLHKALKHWVMNLLREQAIECRETYGNDEKGDILVVHQRDAIRVQQIIDAIQEQLSLVSLSQEVAFLTRLQNRT